MNDKPKNTKGGTHSAQPSGTQKEPTPATEPHPTPPPIPTGPEPPPVSAREAIDAVREKFNNAKIGDVFQTAVNKPRNVHRRSPEVLAIDKLDRLLARLTSDEALRVAAWALNKARKRYTDEFSNTDEFPNNDEWID